MKVVQINASCGSGSTGKICLEVSKRLTDIGIENQVLYSLGFSDYALSYKYTNNRIRLFQSLIEKSLNLHGFASWFTTKKLLKQLGKTEPDVVQLHNLHSHDCDLKMLFSYLKSKKIKVFWTFHDCWAFTGNCVYFDAVGCESWKTACHHCPQNKKYSLFLDNSKMLFGWKRNCLKGVDLHLITPSQWMANLAKQSFLKDYPITVINNGIDLNIFRPTQSDFRNRYHIEDKFILLGVANIWEARKGLDVFVRLANNLDERFIIVLIGTNDRIDKELPSNVISIHRTENQKQMVNIYSAADLFVMPTREENFPTVNIESLACGTPVLTFDTGGSAEIIDDSCGAVVRKDDYEGLVKEIYRIEKERPYSPMACTNRAKRFDCNEKYNEYIELYKGVF